MIKVEVQYPMLLPTFWLETYLIGIYENQIAPLSFFISFSLSFFFLFSSSYFIFFTYFSFLFLNVDDYNGFFLSGYNIIFFQVLTVVIMGTSSPKANLSLDRREKKIIASRADTMAAVS